MKFSCLKNLFIQWFCPKPKRIRKNFSPKSILIISTTGLGDTIWALPAIENIKKELPYAKISILTTRMGKDLFFKNPHLHHIFVYQNFFSSWKTLRKHKFDVIFVFHSSQRAIFPLVSWLKPKMLIGTQGKNKHLDFLFSHLAPSRKCHEVIRRFDQLRELSLPIQWSSPKLYFPKVQTKQHSILLHPGAKDAYKCWPIEYWIQLAKSLIEIFSLHVSVSGSNEERPLLEQIKKSVPKVEIQINLSLRDFVQFIQKQKLIITNDTGPLHLAAALDQPVIGIYSATDPFFCGPFLAKQAYLLARHRPCSPCIGRNCTDPFCMRQIAKKDILEIVKTLCK